MILNTPLWIMKCSKPMVKSNNANGRNTAGQFSAGNSGRPKGSRNEAAIAVEGLLRGQAEALTQTAVTKALEGNSVALRLCMEHIAPTS